MTLEDFLVKAGVVAEGSVAKHKDNLVGSSNMMGGVQGYAQGAHWFHQYHQMSAMDQQQQQAQRTGMDAYVMGRPVPHALSIGANSMLDVVYPDGQVNVSSPTLGALSDSHNRRTKKSNIKRHGG
ncbi:hypothetical protein HPP92_018988 [Vanilla planifolia]|uniref:Uncharacterized protein n=1 Tax=Vanilla planifolia TaxID=51239 RepID=A0A835UMX2_VANPL|nr:hypothetical protein HPP92_018988 [Vanilla planifolia]